MTVQQPVSCDSLRAWGHDIPSWLSVQPAKRSLFGLDLYFREAWEEISAAARTESRLKKTLNTHTLLHFKPDAVVGRRLGAAFDWLSCHDIDVVSVEMVHVLPAMTRALWQYQWNIATRDRMDVSELMMGMCRSLLVVVRMPPDGLPAALRMAALKGPADPAERRPDQLRSSLDVTNYIVNSVHSADEPADVVRELSVFLTAEQRSRALDAIFAGGVQDPSGAIERLYEEVPQEPDLGFESRYARWTDDITVRAGRTGAAESGARLHDLLKSARSGSVNWRCVPEAMTRADIPWSDWDTVILGTTLAEAHLPELVRILPGVSPQDWMRTPS